MQNSWRIAALACAVSSIFIGCSDAEPTAPVTDAGTSADGSTNSVEATLTALGVDIARTPRITGDGEPLSEDYAPLGSRPFGFKLDEVLVAGVALVGHADSVNLFDGVPESRNADGTLAEAFRFESVTLEDNTWDSMDNTGILKRDAIAADIDGDGRDELVAVFQRMSDDRLYAMVQDDQSGDFARTEPTLLSEDAVLDLSHIELAAGDVDADGVFEVAVALAQDAGTSAGGVTLWVLDPSDGHRLTVMDEWTQRIDAEEAGAEVSVAIAAGNLDDDNHDELALVVNEIFSSSTDARARLFLFNSGTGGPAILDAGSVDVEVSDALTRVRIAGCAMGDVDGDGRTDLIIGGLINVNTNCDNAPDMVVGAFRIGASGIESSLSEGAYVTASLGSCESAGPLKVRAAFVNVLDADGDGDMEIAANQAILNFDAETSEWSEIGRVSDASFLPGQSAAFTLDRSNTDVAVADVTGDRRDNLIYVTENAAAVAVWGASTDPAGEISFGTIASFPVDAGRVEDPLIAPINVDRDSYSLSYSPTEYELIFTEPVVVAALAAAPCYASGQNADACVTSFGQGTVTGTDQEASFKITASIIIGLSSGVNVPFVKVEAETEHKISVALGYTFTHAYSVEKSVTYTTGPIEDTVIFTTVPYDRYMYRILEHPDETQVGSYIAYFVPRDPITLQVEREFYNRHVVDGGVELGPQVFSHTAGDPASYPSPTDRDDLLRRFGGLETAAQSVGQGDGSVEVGLDVSEEWGHAGSLALGYEFSAKATAATFIAGYSVGVEVGGSLRWSSGTTSSYHGAVGNLSADTFADNQYSFGLFTYKGADPSGREYQVLQYWVE